MKSVFVLLLLVAPTAFSRTALITGATGGVGFNLLLEMLADPDYEVVHAAVRNPAKLLEQLRKAGVQSDKLRIIRADAPNWDFQGLQVEDVVHTVGVLWGRDRKSDFFPVNVDGTMQMLRTLPRSIRLVILSSLAAHGPTEGLVREGEADKPITWYGESKLEMERRILAEMPELNVVFLRAGAVFGQREAETERLLRAAGNLPIFLKNGWYRKRISFVSIDDLNSAILFLLKRGIDFRALPTRYLYVNSVDSMDTNELFHAAQKVTWGAPLGIVPLNLFWLRLASYLGDIGLLRGLPPSLSAGRVVDLFQTAWTSCGSALRLLGWEAQDTIESALRKSREETLRHRRRWWNWKR